MMRTVTQGSAGKTLLYDAVATKIGNLIEQGTYRPGDRIPSIRDVSRQMRVSVNTVMQAYAHLENLRMIEARPQSGYYVTCRLPEPKASLQPKRAKLELAPNHVQLGQAPLDVIQNIANPKYIPLGRGGPNLDLLPIDKLNRMLASESRRLPVESVSYAGAKGMTRLRAEIAKRSLDSGSALSPDDIVITSGCVEAVTLALQATCRPGDTVAIGSPVYYTFLNSIQWLGLKILEIPCTPREGMSLGVLSYAIKHNPVHACIVISNFNNPLGTTMPDEAKRALVDLLAKHEIPLIEDDVYGDLGFAAVRPIATKAFDKKGLVLYCSSFSKTLAPGYRIGWIAPGRFQEEVVRLKSLFNLATASPTQLGIAEFLANGGYDRHLRTIRRTYAHQMAQMRGAVGQYFPSGTRVTRPDGGFVLWIEMPETVDTFRLYEQALQNGISIAPGTLFTTTDKFRNCIRINSAVWSERIAHGLKTVGSLACEMASSSETEPNDVQPPKPRKLDRIEV